MTKPIYLDYNATTPHDSEVVEAMLPFLQHDFGNPSSSHPFGLHPKEGIEKARLQVAELLHCQPHEIIFTSGGTESNNHAIKGAAFAQQEKGRHIITSVIEHPAVTEVCKALESFGFETTYLPVDEFGMVDPVNVEDAIRPDTILISIMHSNNEVGTLQPIEAIGEISRRRAILFHTDAAQSVGKVPIDIDLLGVDLLSIAGHKLYAPKGIGALYIRRDVKIDKFCHGAGQERGFRAGTENVTQIVGLGKACELALREQQNPKDSILPLRDELYNRLKEQLGERIKLNGHPEKRLPNTLNISFQGLEANRILDFINHELAASAGAACHGDSVKISHVLKAMKVPEEWAKGTVRLSLGRMTSQEEIDKAATIIMKAVKKILP